MSVSHAYFYSFRIIFTFQCSLPAVLDIITQDSERLFLKKIGDARYDDQVVTGYYDHAVLLHVVFSCSSS